MEEARRVLDRLARIEMLQREHALPADLLGELRALLEEAEEWARTERDVPDSALEAIARGRQMLQDTSRTLLA
jgi:hypothetical protein